MKTVLRLTSALTLGVLAQAVVADIGQPSSLEISLPEVGQVEVVVNIAPAAAPQVIVRQHERTLMSFEMGEAGPPDPDSAMQPRGQILLRRFEGLPSPAIVVRVRSPYGTGYRDSVALFAVVKGSLVLLHLPWEAHNLGGICVGPLNQANTSGVVEWNFKWADCHACPNPYKIVTYRWDPSGLRFETEGISKETKKRYSDPDEAVHERYPACSNLLKELPPIEE